LVACLARFAADLIFAMVIRQSNQKYENGRRKRCAKPSIIATDVKKATS
jgi:hypothetical protein